VVAMALIGEKGAVQGECATPQLTVRSAICSPGRVPALRGSRHRTYACSLTLQDVGEDSLSVTRPPSPSSSPSVSPLSSSASLCPSSLPSGVSSSALSTSCSSSPVAVATTASAGAPLLSLRLQPHVTTPFRLIGKSAQKLNAFVKQGATPEEQALHIGAHEL
jgi:hypothetical protein